MTMLPPRALLARLVRLLCRYLVVWTGGVFCALLFCSVGGWALAAGLIAAALALAMVAVTAHDVRTERVGL